MSKSISQLDTEAIAHTTDLFEVAVVDAQSATGYASGKMSAEVIAEGMLNNFTYPTAMPNMQNKTITGAINQMLANFAPVYDATATYSKDDVVTYNGQLYKANQDISVAEAWDSTHWTAIVVKQISGANQHDYSTSEQVVGTWIDGKPLYQKTVDLGEDISVYNTGWFETTISWQALNVDKFINAEGCTASGTYAGTFLCSKNNSGYIEIQTPRNNNQTGLRYFTIQYTKTTD